MHPANQRLGEPDKLAQDAHKQTSYPIVHWRNTLNRGRIPAEVILEAEQERSLREGECKVKE